MELTKEQAIDYSIKIWEELTRTGGGVEEKYEVAAQYGEFLSGCPLCELVNGDCEACPYTKEFDTCISNGYGEKWFDCRSKRDRKFWARKFLRQLLQLKQEN